MKNWNDYKNEYAEKSLVNALEIATVEEIADIISEYVKTREEKGLTQGELAELSGIKQSAISRLESLKAIPQLDTMLRILKPLGLRLAVVKD